MNDFDLWDLFGLNPAEKKIIKSLTKLAKNSAVISRHTEIPKTSLTYILRKLEKRKLIIKIEKGKKVYWKSNLPKIMRFISNLDTSKYGEY